MKKILLLGICFILCSCVSQQKYYVSTNYIDFTNLTRDGFFITEANSVNFEYKTLGLVYSESGSGEVFGEYAKNAFGKKYAVNGWKYANYDDCFAALKREAVNRGANGIVNLKYGKWVGKNNDMNSGKTVTYVYASGMTIKR